MSNFIPLPRLSALVILLFMGSFAEAHFNMLLPDRHSVKRRELVVFTHQWGHPFEHQLSDAPTPQELFAISPEGKRIDLLKSVEKNHVLGSGGKLILTYRLSFAPDERGDYLIYLSTPPIWMKEEEEFVQDTVKVVLHVQAQQGWSNAQRGLELVPLTRPYGLLPGMVFQAEVQEDGKPLRNSLVEIERYNSQSTSPLPPEEHITRTVRTDRNGVATCTLPEAGWWSLTAQKDAGTREHDGKAYPLRRRSTMWIYVDHKAALRSEK